MPVLDSQFDTRDLVAAGLARDPRKTTEAAAALRATCARILPLLASRPDNAASAVMAMAGKISRLTALDPKATADWLRRIADEARNTALTAETRRPQRTETAEAGERQRQQRQRQKTQARRDSRPPGRGRR